MVVNSNTAEDVAQTMDAKVVEAQKMLKLAEAQRMNTDSRKAIFCVIMSSEDYISFDLSLAVLKSVDFANPVELTPKRIMHFQMLFEAIFEHPENLVWNLFTRIALNPNYEALRDGIKFFVKEYVVKTNKVIYGKFMKAKEALNNAEGIAYVIL